MVREILTAIRSTLVLWVLTALIYPLVILLLGQGLFPYWANGSLIRNAQRQVIGSALIGQSFSSDRYFWNRPSTTNYSSFTFQEYDPKKSDNITQKTGTSGASNLAPSNTKLLLSSRYESPNNPDLIERINGTVSQLKQNTIQPTADLVYTSGSSLDPHISVEAARAQIPRIERGRGLETNQVELLISQNTEGRFLGIFGEPRVNVLKLNLALDAFNASS